MPDWKYNLLLFSEEKVSLSINHISPSVPCVLNPHIITTSIHFCLLLVVLRDVAERILLGRPYFILYIDSIEWNSNLLCLTQVHRAIDAGHYSFGLFVTLLCSSRALLLFPRHVTARHSAFWTARESRMSNVVHKLIVKTSRRTDVHDRSGRRGKDKTRKRANNCQPRKKKK